MLRDLLNHAGISFTHTNKRRVYSVYTHPLADEGTYLHEHPFIFPYTNAHILDSARANDIGLGVGRRARRTLRRVSDGTRGS